MEWFVGCLGRAIEGAQNILGGVLAKARFWERTQSISLNDRQRLVLNRLLDGVEGLLTTTKYAKLTGCSQDTALRDILALVEHGMLVRNPAGGAPVMLWRSTGSHPQALGDSGPLIKSAIVSTFEQTAWTLGC
jgi:Fic family protein